jgi:PKD repeat protein
MARVFKTVCLIVIAVMIAMVVLVLPVGAAYYEPSISADVWEGPVPLTVNFEVVWPAPELGFNNDVALANGTYEWDFDGDGITDLTEYEGCATYTYNCAGEYYVTVTLSSEVVVEAEGPVTVFPVADFTASPLMGQAPLTVQFRDQSKGLCSGSWSWSFGDGEGSSSQYPSHTYQNGGTYTVSLTVSGSPTATKTMTNYIIVEGAGGVSDLVVRNLYISGTQVMPRDKVVITADVFNEGGAWGDGDVDLIINGAYEQSVGVGVAPGTSQPISFTVYKVAAGEYQVVVGNAVGTFYVLEEQQPSQIGGIPMDTGTLIALCIIGLLVIAGVIVAIIYLKPS